MGKHLNKLRRLENERILEAGSGIPKRKSVFDMEAVEIDEFENELKEKRERQMKEFLAKISLLKHEAGELKLWKSLHALDDAQNKAGWEVAEILEKGIEV